MINLFILLIQMATLQLCNNNNNNKNNESHKFPKQKTDTAKNRYIYISIKVRKIAYFSDKE